MSKPTPGGFVRTPEDDRKIVQNQDRFAGLAQTSAGAAVAPNEIAVARGGLPPCTVDPIPAFQLMFDPRCFIVLDGQVVPNLKKLKYMPGVNGAARVTAPGPNGTTIGRVDVSAVRLWRERNGQVAIPFTAIPRAHVGRADLHQTPGMPPCYVWAPTDRPSVHLTIYERVFPGSDVIECDAVGYLEFLTALRDEHNLVGRCPPHLLRRMLTSSRERADTKATQAAQRPEVEHLARHAKALAAEVATIEAELALYDAAPREPSAGAAAPPGM